MDCLLYIYCDVWHCSHFGILTLVYCFPFFVGTRFSGCIGERGGGGLPTRRREGSEGRHPHGSRSQYQPSHRQRSDRGGIRAGEMEPRLLLRTAVLSVLLVLYRDG